MTRRRMTRKQVGVELKGFKELDNALHRLAQQMRADVMHDALVESASDMEEEYRRGAHEEFKHLVDTRKVLRTATRAEVNVGTRHPLVHIFEYGTRLRYRKSGAGTGKIRRAGFARRAFDTRIGSWFEEVGRELGRRLKNASR